jgi:putative endonuclease
MTAHKMTSVQSGKLAEEQACSYLLANGLLLIRKNYRTPLGEIDLIMRDQQTWVFVEVRSRKNNQYVSNTESIGVKKRRKIIKSATFYLQKNRLLGRVSCRFDVLSITLSTAEGGIEWIKDAFQVQ